MQSSDTNQRLGDSWAGTAVVKSSALPESAKRSAGLVSLGLFAGIVVGCVFNNVLTLVWGIS